MKRIYPEEQKVQPAHSFYSATGVILLKRKPLTSTTVFLFRLREHEALKHHSRQQGEKNVFLKKEHKLLYTIMFSSMDDRVFFPCTQDNVTLLRARELDTRTRGFTLYRQVLQTICTHSERRSNPNDTLEWLCLSCNYLRLTKATFWPSTLPLYLVSSIYISVGKQTNEQ